LSQGPSEPAGEGARPLNVLTFEAGEFLFAVPASDVERILPEDQSPPGGTRIVDAAGLLRKDGDTAKKGCLVLLSDRDSAGDTVAVRANRAGEVRALAPETLLPLPGFLFRGENPFLGVVAPEDQADGRPVFVIAGPERLQACAGAL
jgi:hypothetical protein